MKIILGSILTIAVLAGCGTGDSSAADVKAKESAISKANEEMMKKDPPPPGEGPTD
jgi:hypothetical protein